MTIDEQVLDLLLQWEEMSAKGKKSDIRQLAAGDANLEQRLKRHLVALGRVAWLKQESHANVQLPLPSPDLLSVSLLLPAGLSSAQLQANIAKANVVDPARYQELLNGDSSHNATQLSQRLLDTDLLTRFQLRAIAHGRTRGLKLGRYVILDKLGEGGMGQVFKARHSKMGRIVAVKVLPREAMSKANSVARFNQEVSVASQLSHPNIVTAFDADEAEGLHFLVMEYVEGKDLNTIVRRQGPLSTAAAVNCILQAARGLEYAHGVGLVHRDIKPANLLRDANGVVKILDMGIARIQGDEPSNQANITQNGAVMGTVDFMAPEQAVDAKKVDARADIYSLGCTLYYLLTRRPPFTGDTLMAKLIGHREQPAPSLQALRGDVPAALEAIYQKCMAKLPSDRYQNASELVADLLRVQPLLTNDSRLAEDLPLGPDLETSRTGVFDTQSQFDSNPLMAQLKPLPPTKSITSVANPARRPAVRNQKFAYYGMVFCIALLLLFAGYYALGAIFNIATPDGNLVVQVEGEDFVTHLRDQVLSVVNVKTNEETTIRLAATEQTQKLSPGDYRFALKTSSGLKTDVSEVTISSGGDSQVHVSWAPNEVASPVVPPQVAIANPPPSPSMTSNNTSPPSTPAPEKVASLPPAKPEPEKVASVPPPTPEPEKVVGLPPAEPWPNGEWIFNGRDLTGWRETGDRGWRVENAVIVGELPVKGWLMFNRPESNFELEFEYRLDANGDSGILLEGIKRDKSSQSLEFSILDETSPKYAKTVPEARTGSLFLVKAATPVSPTPQPMQWQRYSLRYDGQTIVVTINGQEVLHYTTETKLAPVNFGFQRLEERVEFQNIRLRRFTTPIDQPADNAMKTDANSSSVPFDPASVLKQIAEAAQRGDTAAARNLWNDLRTRPINSSVNRVAQFALRGGQNPPVREARGIGISGYALADLKPSAGTEQFVRNRSALDGSFIRLGDQFYETGIAFVDSKNNHVEFDLSGGNWNKLRAIAGIQVVDASVQFVVKGDGRELLRWTATSQEPSKSILLDIQGVSKLELITEPIAGQNSSGKPVLASAYVERSSS